MRNHSIWNTQQMGKGDLAFAYVENTKETAININEALGILLSR
jgi:hypothetical protein|nr:hypothetical protein [Bacteroides intestinalis]